MNMISFSLIILFSSSMLLNAFEEHKQINPCAKKCHAYEACKTHRECVKKYKGACIKNPHLGDCQKCNEKSAACLKCWKACPKENHSK